MIIPYSTIHFKRKDGLRPQVSPLSQPGFFIVPWQSDLVCEDASCARSLRFALRAFANRGLKSRHRRDFLTALQVLIYSNAKQIRHPLGVPYLFVVNRQNVHFSRVNRRKVHLRFGSTNGNLCINQFKFFTHHFCVFRKCQM